MADAARPLNRHLAQCINVLEEAGWSALVLDAGDGLVWISEASKGFLHEPDDERVGVGTHIVEALASPVWLSTITGQSTLDIAGRAAPPRGARAEADRRQLRRHPPARPIRNRGATVMLNELVLRRALLVRLAPGDDHIYERLANLVIPARVSAWLTLPRNMPCPVEILPHQHGHPHHET
ncbi:MAG TPA: hypothetical protein VFA70_01495 [Dehalococcoidia bacterium]|nr:hypothetical protein [Dehalococcoidia bacterium]